MGRDVEDVRLFREVDPHPVLHVLHVQDEIEHLLAVPALVGDDGRQGILAQTNRRVMPLADDGAALGVWRGGG